MHRKFKTKVNPSSVIREWPLAREWFQVQTCLGCCEGDVDRWVIAAHKLGDRWIHVWSATLDQDLWHGLILPAVRSAKSQLETIMNLLRGGAVSKSYLGAVFKKSCHPRRGEKEEIARLAEDSIRKHCVRLNPVPMTPAIGSEWGFRI